MIGLYEPKNTFSDAITLPFTDLCLYLFEGFKIEILLQKIIQILYGKFQKVNTKPIYYSVQV